MIEAPLAPARAALSPPLSALPEAMAGPLIGPHAVIHMAESMAERLGPWATAAVLASAQIEEVPQADGGMIPEIEALRLHRWLLLKEPVEGFAITREAARRTADYIIANRIPGAAVALLRALPARIAAPLLMRAIARHAWTFIGGGAFLAESAWSFTIDRTAAEDPMPVPDSTFEWYGAVFERLFQRLVAGDCRIELAPVRGASEPVHHFRLVRGARERRA
ncbi:MAG: bacteriochlorophyll 4-vinyl reductase [Erythrobacter sp.]|nr:bacteriochlorophyll 4-vinyl reductase [Erythrobacter sp.]